MPDTAPVHTEAVTDTPDPAAAEQAAHAALLSHRATCPARIARTRCEDCARLTAAWRQALRHASLNHAPAGGQITTNPSGRMTTRG